MAKQGNIHFSITADNDDFKLKLAETRQGILDSRKTAESEGTKIETMVKRTSMVAMNFFSVDMIKNFGRQLIEITGKFQTFEAVLTNTLQSPQKAKAAMDMLKDFATTTPFQVDDLIGSFVKLANQGFVPTYDEMVKLGDLASSTGQGFGQLSEAIIGAQAGEFDRLKEFGILASKEGDKVTFTFKEQQTQVAFTASSIRDYILSLGDMQGVAGANAQIAETLTGKYSNLQDAITQMMNEIGQSSEGVLSGALDRTGYLVENYKDVGDVLMDLIAIYGIYKAAVILLSAVEKVRLTATLSGEVALSITTKQVTTLQALRYVATMKLKSAQDLLNIAMAKNPYLLIGILVAGLVVGTYKLIKALSSETEAEKELREEQERKLTRNNDYLASMAKEQAEVDILFGKLKALTVGTKAYNDTKDEIISKYGQYIRGLGDEITSLRDIEGAYKAISEAAVQSARNRAITDVTSNSASNYAKIEAENLKNIRDELLSNFGNMEGEKLFTKIKESLRENGGLTEELKNILGYQKEVKAGFEEPLPARDNTFLTNSSIKRNNLLNMSLRTQIDYIISSKKKMKTEIEEVENILGGIFTKGGEVDVQKITKLNDVTTSIKTAQKELSSLQSKTSWTREEEKRIDELTKKLSEYHGKYKSLTGLDYDKNDNVSNDNKDIQAKIEKEEQEKIRLYKDMEFAVRQADIDTKDEGLQKVLEQNRLNYDKEMEQIRRQKEDKLAKIQEWERTIWESENKDWKAKGLKFEPTTKILPKEEEANFGTFEKTANVKFGNSNKKAYEDELNQYTEFASQYIAKKNEFDENIKNLQKQSENSSSIDEQKVMEDNIASVTAMQNNILSSLDEEMEMKNQTFVTFVEGMVNMGLQELLNALATSEAALNAEVSKGGDKGDNAEKLKKEIATLKARILQLSKEKKEEDKPIEEQSDPAKRWKDTLSVMNDVKSITSNITSNFEGMDDATKAVLDAAMNIATGVIGMIIGITTLGTTSAVTTKMVADTTAESIKGVEKASVILAIISAAIQVVMAIANLLTSLFNKDKKKEKEINVLQEQVDALEMSYDSLGKAIDKAYSTDASNLIEEQNANLLNQKKLIEEQKRLEEDKKKTDDDKINEYDKTLSEIDQKLEENKERAVDVIFGEDLKSAIDNFASAYADAWTSGEDRAAAQKDVVKKMIQNVVSEIVKSNIADKVKELRESIKAAIDNDGEIDAYEQKQIDRITDDIYAQSEKDSKWADKFMTDGSNAKEQSATAGGFETMSQETASELNGTFFSMRNNMSLAKDVLIQLNETAKMMLMKMSNGESLTDTPRLVAIAVGHLEAIQRNTSHLEEMKNDLKQVKNNTERL